MDWTALLAAYLGGQKKPSDSPMVTSASPAFTSLFDASGWQMNYGGNQTATSTGGSAGASTNPALPSLASLMGGSGVGALPVNTSAGVTLGTSGNTTMYVIAAIGLVVLWKLSR